MWGCCSLAARRISRSNRSALTPAAISGGSTFTTTWRPSRTSSARNTRLMPPPPSSLSIRYAVPRADWRRSRSSATINDRAVGLEELGEQNRQLLDAQTHSGEQFLGLGQSYR